MTCVAIDKNKESLFRGMDQKVIDSIIAFVRHDRHDVYRFARVTVTSVSTVIPVFL